MSEELVKAASAELQQRDNAATLTLTDISARLKVPYGKLRGFAAAPGVAEWVGAQEAGGKGLRFPESAVAQFDLLLRDGLITPKTVGKWLVQRGNVAMQQRGNATIAQTDGDGIQIAAMLQSSNAAMVRELTAAFREHSEELRLYRQSQPAPDDILLTVTEAHERYGLALSTLRTISFVEGRRRKVRRSDVLGLIQGMGKAIEGGKQ